MKGWRAPELVRVPLAREEYRRVRNNLLPAYRIERVLFKQALCPSIAKEKRCESIGVSF